jgi:hypothetical protein
MALGAVKSILKTVRLDVPASWEVKRGKTIAGPLNQGKKRTGFLGVTKQTVHQPIFSTIEHYCGSVAVR